MTKPKFSIGDHVAAIALPNGWPQPRPRIDGLQITDIRLIKCSSIPSYYRVTAYGKGMHMVEGAESHFEHESCDIETPKARL